MIAFAVSGAVPRLRRHAILALVAPAAFGFWALIGYITWVLVCMFVLKIQLRPVGGFTGHSMSYSFLSRQGFLDPGCRFGSFAEQSGISRVQHFSTKGFDPADNPTLEAVQRTEVTIA